MFNKLAVPAGAGTGRCGGELGPGERDHPNPAVRVVSPFSLSRLRHRKLTSRSPLALSLVPRAVQGEGAPHRAPMVPPGAQAPHCLGELQVGLPRGWLSPLCGHSGPLSPTGSSSSPAQPSRPSPSDLHSGWERDWGRVERARVVSPETPKPPRRASVSPPVKGRIAPARPHLHWRPW